MADVLEVFSQGQMNASLPPGAGVRIIIAVECEPGDIGQGNWKYRITSQSSQRAGEWSTDLPAEPVETGVSSLPTAEVSDVDLLYPYNELAVFWAGSGDPSAFTVRAWAIYP